MRNNIYFHDSTSTIYNISEKTQSSNHILETRQQSWNGGINILPGPIMVSNCDFPNSEGVFFIEQHKIQTRKITSTSITPLKCISDKRELKY